MEKSSLLQRLELQCQRVKNANGWYTHEAKKIACQIMESENLSRAEVSRELNVHPSVVVKWPLQIKHKEVFAGKKVKFTESEKIAIVRSIDSGTMRPCEATEKYTVCAGTIRVWRKRYSLQFYPQSRLTQSMAGEVNKDSSEESAILQSRIEELEKALSEEKLKVESLQTMIKVAEQEFNIGIRKKFGAKQSES